MSPILGGSVLILCGLLLLALAVHPFATYPLSLRLLRRWRPVPVRPGTRPATTALCVCAYNEEAVIRRKVENMLAMRDALPDLELLIYVDASSDRTAEIVRDYDGAVRLLVGTTRQGKTAGMNSLVALTAAELLIFSDANVLFDAQALPALLAPFGDPDVGAVCGHLVYTGARDSGTAQAGSAYWRLEEHIKALESATGSVMGADGSIFAMRHDLHHPPPADLIDDMYVSLALLSGGARVVRARDAVAWEETVSSSTEEFRRKMRISCQAMNVHRALWPRLRRMPWLDRYKYVSHKLLRWLTIYLLGAGAALILAGLVVAGAWQGAAGLLAAGLAGLAVLMLARSGPLAALREILAAFLATGVGVFRSMQGARYQTWSPPASARKIPSLAAERL